MARTDAVADLRLHFAIGMKDNPFHRTSSFVYRESIHQYLARCRMQPATNVLQSLVIEEGSLQSLPPNFDSMENLRDVWINSQNHSGVVINPSQCPPGLESLHLCFCNILEDARFEYLTSLTRLHIETCHMAMLPPGIGALGSLQELSLQEIFNLDSLPPQLSNQRLSPICE